MLTQQLKDIAKKIELSSLKAGKRPQNIKLVAVSKFHDAELMNEYLNVFQHVQPSCHNQVIFGEAYVQEYKNKVNKLQGDFKTHLIGAFQSNKVKDAIKLFDVIQSVHKKKLLELINEEAKKAKKVQNIYLQVNISQDDDKSGFNTDDALNIIKNDINRLDGIKLCGLMTITKQYDEPQEARGDFIKMKHFYDEIFSWVNSNYNNRPDSFELSMGMSDDFDIAIEEGATMVRIGHRLFGERGYPFSNL